MVRRQPHLERLAGLLRQFPVVAILGPRQVGKTTLAQQFAAQHKGPVHHFDIEKPADLRALADPMLALESRQGLVILDEIQRLPEVFPVLRVLADRKPMPARFLILGSAAPALLQQSSETLAGRIAHLYLTGFSPDEVGTEALTRLWQRGGFPRSYLARSDADSHTWREEFITAFLERDLPQLGFRTPATTLRRFWTMVAHWHGRTWNGAEFGRSLGVSDHTARHHLDLLAATFVVRILPPFHENLRKRQVKSPKVYLADSGLLHTLLGIASRRDLEGHPQAGLSFESFALQAVVQHLGARSHECFFWATHSGPELDLLVVRGKRRIGFEFKLGSAPELTPSMTMAQSDLGLQKLWVIHAGKDRYRLAADVEALPLRDLSALPQLGG